MLSLHRVPLSRQQHTVSSCPSCKPASRPAASYHYSSQPSYRSLLIETTALPNLQFCFARLGMGGSSLPAPAHQPRL